MPSRRTVLAATAGTAASLALSGTAHADDHKRDSRLRSLISRMTLEEKVGQLFVMRVYGHSATAPDQADIDANLKEIGVRTAAEMIARYRVGGIIYFTWAHNTRDPHQIADLSNGIQQASLRQPRGLPVLISTDQEHGIVCRVGEPATLFPGAMAMGAGGSRTDARTLGRIAGQELRAIGIRQNYSPSPTSTSTRPTRSSACAPSVPILKRSPGSWPPRSPAIKVPGSPRRPSTSRGTGTPRSTATTVSRSSPTAGSSGRSWTPCPSGPRSGPASTRS